MTSRRQFLVAGPCAPALAGQAAAPRTSAVIPWHKRTLRWGQTNITERDPEQYDVGFWRAHWKRTRVQGVIVNAGGIVAYYPSKFPLHHRAEFLGGRDLFGELTRAAHDDGLFVMARMDSNRTKGVRAFDAPRSLYRHSRTMVMPPVNPLSRSR